MLFYSTKAFGALDSKNVHFTISNENGQIVHVNLSNEECIYDVYAQTLPF